MQNVAAAFIAGVGVTLFVIVGLSLHVRLFTRSRPRNLLREVPHGFLDRFRHEIVRSETIGYHTLTPTVHEEIERSIINALRLEKIPARAVEVGTPENPATLWLLGSAISEEFLVDLVSRAIAH